MISQLTYIFLSRLYSLCLFPCYCRILLDRTYSLRVSVIFLLRLQSSLLVELRLYISLDSSRC